LLDFDARKLRKAAAQSQEGSQFDALLYGLNHLIDHSDQRWMFSHEIPPNDRSHPDWDGRFMPDCYPRCSYRESQRSDSDERWMLTSYCIVCSEQVVRSDPKIVFYRGLSHDLTYFTKQMRKALLGFYCKECDRRYNPSQRERREKLVFRGFGFDNFDMHFSIIPMRMRYISCPNGHQL